MYIEAAQKRLKQNMETKAVSMLVVLVISAIHTPVQSSTICMDYAQFLTIIKINKTIINAECINWSFRNISDLTGDTFSKFTNLQLVNLSNNQLTSLPKGLFDRQRQLKEINISYNLLQGLPIRLFQDKVNIEVVDLSHNRLKFISNDMFNYILPHFRHLDLQHNLLTTVEPWVINYGHYYISWIDLRFNNISDITNDRNFTYHNRQLSANEKLLFDLRNNSFTTWHDRYITQFRPNQPIAVSAMAIVADFRDNHWVCDCNFHHLVKDLDTSYIKWSFPELFMLTCSEPERLSGKRIFYDISLHEFVCNVTDNCPQGCMCQENPEKRITTIDCRNAGLEELPVSLPNIKYANIAMLLDNNNLTKLEHRSYSNQISHISIANNKLTSISNQFIDDITETSGAFLDLRGNHLTTLPENTQKIPLRNIRIEENKLVCSCDMLWMVGWINVEEHQFVDRKKLLCEYHRELRLITDLTADFLKCHEETVLYFIFILGSVIVIVIIVLVTAARCPYETKVILFKTFRIHPADKYIVDKAVDKDTDIVISFDESDPYVIQWVIKVLVRRLEMGKPWYKVALAARDMKAGCELESRLDMMESSRRILVVFSAGYEDNEWCQYDSHNMEILDQSQGRIVYILFDKASVELAAFDPWKSKMSNRKTFCVGEKLFWDKLRYELPRK